MNDSATLHRLAAKIREDGFLGQSRLLTLFDFLVESTAAGTAPKEIVIAAHVFQKTATFDVSQDSIVRVYIHNLRRKLQQYYAGPGKNQPLQLALPKGEYRLVVMPMDVSVDPLEILRPAAVRVTTWTPWLAAGIAVLVCAALVGFDLYHRPHDSWAAVRTSTVWSRLLQNDKPIVVVLGDYYIFGDRENTPDVTRLVREFSLNSKIDLEQYLQIHPNLAEQYVDVGLGYLPTSCGVALADIMAVLAVADKRRVQVVLMSSLTPSSIKSANIVYVGLLSGLGALKDVVFGSSRFQIGDSYDELIDRKTSHHYVSSANQYAGEHGAFGGKTGYRDYGLFSTFAGPDGNQFVIIAGTQDEGLRQMAEAMTGRSNLDELTRQSVDNRNFEALFEVLSLDSLNLNGTLLATSPLDPSKIWSPR